MSEPKMVCAKCGSDRIDAEVEARGWGKAEIGLDSKGKPYVDHVYDREFDDHDEVGFRCADCSHRAGRLADMVKPEHLAGIDFHPGDRVMLPDGAPGVVDVVNARDNTFTVEGWHEVFQAGEGTLIQPAQVAA